MCRKNEYQHDIGQVAPISAAPTYKGRLGTNAYGHRRRVSKVSGKAKGARHFPSALPRADRQGTQVGFR